MAQAKTSMAGAAVNPFRINVPEEDLVDLCRRIAAMSIAAAQLGMIGCAKEQSSEETQGALMSEEPPPAAETAPEGPGSVSGAPHLTEGFTDTFTSRYIDTGDVRLHAVIGGDGPPLLLVHGWPQTWYAWRLLMPALARDFQVIAVDQRGIGLSDKPEDGYDTGTLAGDLIGLMDVLGHDRFAVVGHDTGFAIGYALAADHPDRIDRVALAEIPGSPGAAPAPPVLVPGPVNDRLWHLPFNRLEKINEQLVVGRER